MGLSINADDIHLFRKYCTFFLPRIVNLKEENRPKWVSFSFPDPLGELFDLSWNEYASSVEWSEIDYKRTDIDYDDNFRLYMTSRLANPHFSPELAAKATIIDFTVT